MHLFSKSASSARTALGYSRSKHRLFAIVIVLFWAAIGIISAELILRYKDRHTRLADQIDAGLLCYDELLGWSLTPNWSGEHKNVDFSVRYTINGEGFRHDPIVPDTAGNSAVVVLGDSFTFGIGVNDDQTFVHYLNEVGPNGLRFYNYAIPGTSTDQQILLFERQLIGLKPSRVILVLYLGNDLIDNQLNFPIQMNLAKPRFLVRDDHLFLSNVPVQRSVSGGKEARQTMAQAMFGYDHVQTSLRYRLESRSALLRFISETLLPTPSIGGDFFIRHDSSINLCILILERIAADCEKSHTQFTLALLCGRSFIENQQSIPSLYQGYIRDRLMDAAKQRKWSVVDLAQTLRTTYNAKQGKWFFPHDGHLTAIGHQLVARSIANSMSFK